jgi:hypothetical protein
MTGLALLVQTIQEKGCLGDIEIELTEVQNKKSGQQKQMVRMATRTTNPEARTKMPLPLMRLAIGSVGCMFGSLETDLICNVFAKEAEFLVDCE